MHNAATRIFEKIEEAREEIDAVYAASPKFGWACWFALLVPLAVLGLDFLLPESPANSPYAALTNSVSAAIRQHLPLFGLIAVVSIAGAASKIFRKEKQRLCGFQCGSGPPKYNLTQKT